MLKIRELLTSQDRSEEKISEKFEGICEQDEYSPHF